MTKKRKRKKPREYWFEQSSFYITLVEKEELRTYLDLWKKFFIKKLPPYLVFKREEWIVNGACRSITLRVCMRPKKTFKEGKKALKSLKKVGATKIGYTDIEYDCDGWVDAKRFAPAQFDLVRLKTQRHTINGWHTGEKWFSLRLRDIDNVLYWKKGKEVY